MKKLITILLILFSLLPAILRKFDEDRTERWYQGYGNQTEGMTITRYNKFGIYTISPSYNLHIVGDMGATTANITNLSATNLESDLDGTGYDLIIADINSSGTTTVNVLEDGTATLDDGIWIGLVTVNATEIDCTNLEADNLETDLDGTGYDLIVQDISANGTITTNILIMNGGNIELNGEYLSGDGGDEGVFVSSNGYVGIGTNDPSDELHIKGDNPDLVIENSDATGGGFIELKGDTSSGDTALGFIQGEWDDNFAAKIAFMAGSDISNKDEGSIAFYVSDGASIPDRRVDITKEGYLNVSERVGHRGDVNTYMKFTDDQIDFYSGSQSMLQLDESTTDKVVVNPSNYNVIFQVHGDNKDSLIATNASNDYVIFGGGVAKTPLEKTSTYSALFSDHMILCSGNITIDLPHGLDGQILIIKNKGPSTVTVDASESETIDGALTQTLTQYNCITIVCDKAVGWWIINDNR